MVKTLKLEGQGAFLLFISSSPERSYSLSLTTALVRPMADLGIEGNCSQKMLRPRRGEGHLGFKTIGTLQGRNCMVVGMQGGHARLAKYFVVHCSDTIYLNGSFETSCQE